MFTSMNQYPVIMEVARQFWQGPQGLNAIYLRATNGSSVVPLSAIAHYLPTTAPIAVNHQGQFPSVTISFNLVPGFALSDAVKSIQQMEQTIKMPETVHGSFSGTLQAFQQSLGNELYLIIAALVAVYIVLGILYESYIHPITILSTLPSAGVGAVLALLIFRTDMSVIAIIGVLLLIGIVKKNAILMVDFAIAAEREEGKNSRDAIYRGLPPAVPSDFDDDHVGHLRRVAADFEQRDRFGIPPSARHHDYRRLDLEPGADAVHHAGGLSLF